VSGDVAIACPQCGVIAPVADGQSKGDRKEIDTGTAGGLTNTGLVKRKNQDALYLQELESGAVVVVCDGVSSSAAADAAARVACAAAGRSLSTSSSAPDQAMRAAIAVAQRAVLGVPWERSGELAAPSCTFIAARWDGRQVTVGSLGDSRAYWIDDTESRRLTDDDSWVREQVEAGAMTESEAEAHPYAHQITRWLGADAPDEPPDITTFTPRRPGRLVVCTDGLWNYVSDADELAALVRGTDNGLAPLPTARALVDHALMSGGHDNVTVAVIDVVPNRAEG
jgi:serine/threonine protein phosphatase PrpC